MASRKLTRKDLADAAEKYKQWGKWGPDDEIGTLNNTTPEDIVTAAKLVRKGKVISLALNFDHNGPQGAKSKYPSLGRVNPVHTMLRTGTDAYAGVLDHRGIRASDDMDLSHACSVATAAAADPRRTPTPLTPTHRGRSTGAAPRHRLW